MFRFLLNMSLQNKLLILVILTSIIPITLLATFTYQNSIQVMEEQLSRAEEDKLTQVNKQLSFFFSDMDQMSLYLYRNDMVQRVLAEPETRSHTKKYEDYLAVNDLFDTMTSSMNWTLNLYIIGLNGDRYFTGDYLPRQYDQYMEGWGIFRKANEAKGHLVWNTHQSINHPQGDDIALTGGRLLKDITSGEVLGYLVIDVMNQTMLDLYADTTHEDGHMYLLDGQDYIVSSQPTNKVKGEKFSLDSFNHKDMEGGFVQYVTEEESYVIVHNENEKHDFSFVSMVPDVEVRKLADEFLTLTVVIAVVALIIFSWAAYFLSKTLTRPLYELMELLRRFANGDHTVRFTRNYNDDIGRLGNNFNQMAHKVNHLIKEDYEKEMLLKESELKALQAQINPHFLYNTLETVNWMARMNGVKQISDVVVSLGGMMRYTISRGDNLVPLEDELTQLNHYLTIQKVRYKDKFDVEIDVDQSALAVLVPTLVIQPIVENAISHGLERKLGHGRLQLHVMEETNSIQIVIADNGVGMNEQVLADVLSGKERKKYRGGGTGIGLQNVRRRFGIYYGEKGSFHITSSPSIGTEVKITIPIQNRMDDGNHDHS